VTLDLALTQPVEQLMQQELIMKLQFNTNNLEKEKEKHHYSLTKLR